ncbi:MAG: Holliday junction DNA helicase RuvA [Hyphomicrobiaceae bacterium]|jgi:Holliday junction DNA helicase RuvA
MISKLRGTLDSKTPGEVVIDCGGVGYGAVVSLSTFGRLPEVGAPLSLLIVTNLRENALELFGFAEESERRAFLVLRAVSGVGPRLALAILSGIQAHDLAKVVADADAARLVSIPGIGRKTADRLLVELRDKLEAGPAVDAGRGIDFDAVAALTGLGYKHREAAVAVEAERVAAKGSLEVLIRCALARLSK